MKILIEMLSKKKSCYMTTSNESYDQHSASNMQMAIITALENASALYPDDQNFVPQSILWQRLSEPEGGPPLEGEAREVMYRRFLSALAGKKNSLALFESTENPENPDDIKWRLRPQTPESAAIYLTKGDSHTLQREEQQQQILELQKVLTSLRRQASKLDADNRQYALVVEQMKQSTSKEIQHDFDIFESLYNFIETSSKYLENVEKDILNIGQKIDKVNQSPNESSFD